MRKIETVTLAVAATALAVVGALLAQESAPPAAPTPPAASAPPADDAPSAPGPVSDEEFIPSQELNADDQVTFPVDI